MVAFWTAKSKGNATRLAHPSPKIGIASYREMKARTLRTMEASGLLRLERGERGP